MFKICKMNYQEKTEGEAEEYQVEIIYKSQNTRRRLDLNVRIMQNQDEDGEFYVHKTIIQYSLYPLKKWENVSSHLSWKWMSFQPKRSNNDIRRICQYHFQIMEIADIHRVILFLFLRKGGNTNRLIFENITLRQNDNILSLT